MTIPMNNIPSNSSRERVQLLYKKNAELEINRRKAAQTKITLDPNAWQQMRENYESILLEDHAFSEKHDIEYALWQLHYKRIEELRAHYNSAQASALQNAKGLARSLPDRITKIRSQFKTFLSEATGFYHDLMVKIRAKYGLSLGYMSDDSQNDKVNESIDVKKGLISCHRCLIYLGDLARYKGLYVEGDSKARDFAAASSYYMQAATLMPSNGNPHHQLAILASYSGDELLAVYRYFRSLAVDTPFTTARDNLIIAFEKNRQSYCQLLLDSKPTPPKKLPGRMNGKGRNRGETRVSLKNRKTEPHIVLDKDITVPETLKAFSIRFVRLNGILFTRTSLETFEEVFSMALTDFRHLLSSGPNEVLNFGSDFNECKHFVTRFVSIMIFTVHNANKETENQSYSEILQRSVVLKNAFTAIFELMALIVDRSFQLKDPSGSFLLPGIMIFVQWLAYSEDNAVVTSEMDEKQATARSLFWNNLVSFLNKIILSSSGSHNDETCFFNMSRNEGETVNRLALPEDIELRGFLPLVPGQLILDYSRTNYFGNDGNREKDARVQRILATGKAIATKVRSGQQGIYFDSKLNKFFYGFEPAVEVSDIKQEISEEFEDEDEIIVFKPSAPEKHIDESSKSIIVNSSSSLISHGVFPSEQFAEPNTSKSMVGGDDIENGFSNLNLFGNGLNEQDHATMIPSKFDSVMTSAPCFDSSPSKTKFSKSPVGRPVRHFGPPPGFSTPKHMNENQGLDDYSWLDGYQLPYSGSFTSNGFGNAFDCLPQPNKLLNTSKTSLGMECFPFPGKQVSTTVSANVGIGIGNGNGNGWLNNPFPEHSSLYQEPVKKGNEQFLAVPQQYQGQSLWEGRFFV